MLAKLNVYLCLRQRRSPCANLDGSGIGYIIENEDLGSTEIEDAQWLIRHTIELSRRATARICGAERRAYEADVAR